MHVSSSHSCICTYRSVCRKYLKFVLISKIYNISLFNIQFQKQLFLCPFNTTKIIKFNNLLLTIHAIATYLHITIKMQTLLILPIRRRILDLFTNCSYLILTRQGMF